MANIPTHDSTSLRVGEASGNVTFSMDTSVTTKIYPSSTFAYTSTNYSMPTNVVTKIYPAATAMTYTFAEPATTYTLVGDGTSINLTWQEASPSVAFALTGDAPLTFAQPGAELRLRLNSVVIGSYGIDLTPSSDFLLVKPNYIDASNTLRLTPEAELSARVRVGIAGKVITKITPSVTQWAFNGIVTGRRFVPGYFATKSAGSVDSAAETRVKLLAVTSPFFGEEGSINDLWMRFFNIQFVPEGSINDRMAYWLRYEKGVSGDSINDLLSNWNGVL